MSLRRPGISHHSTSHGGHYSSCHAMAKPRCAAESSVLRMGSIYKQGRKRGWFGRDNWKVRYAILTTKGIYYYTHRGGALKGYVDLTHSTFQDIEIMPTDCLKRPQDVSTIWRIAIRTPGRRFVMAALSQEDMNTWAEALETAIQHNGRYSAGSSVDTRYSCFEHYTEMQFLQSQRSRNISQEKPDTPGWLLTL
ncbi:unnamed protein product [Aphanomyces euteiches]